MSHKPEDSESDGQEKKQIPVGKKRATALKSGCTGILFSFWGNSGFGCPVCFLCFYLSAYLVSISFCLLLQEKSDDHFSAN